MSAKSVIGEHPSMRELARTVHAVAPSSATILLEGESGTGKRLVAQAIHEADAARCRGPFVEFSCGALPETLLDSELFGHVRGAFTGAIRDKQGRFELAHGGTLLLDEIDTCTPALQVKLLRVIQDRTFERVGDTETRRIDVRMIAATNRPLATLVGRGNFRNDLYYRLNVITIRVPALRERASDIPLLAAHFLAHSAGRAGKSMAGISPDAMDALQRYAWPGNVRELEHAIERAVIIAEGAWIEHRDLPEPIRFGEQGSAMRPAEEGLRQALEGPERLYILQALDGARWNRTQAAKRLGIHRSTLYHKLRRLQIQPMTEAAYAGDTL